MEGMDKIRVGAGPVALGRLEELQSFDERPRLAAGLPGNIPVLTFPLRPSEAQCLSRNYRGYQFGFGHVETGDGMLLTMRLQLEAVQFYWIAQMTDPELWAAIDMWRREQRIPVGLKIQNGKAWDISFLVLDMPLPTPLTAEKYRRAPQRVVTPHDWKCMAALTGGLMQIQAVTGRRNRAGDGRRNGAGRNGVKRRFERAQECGFLPGLATAFSLFPGIGLGLRKLSPSITTR
ncbi:hypothetical protein Bphy_6958 (plasmid) [Paraburkholderia phymatum STM815]|uniref:Uncharacterized protein n=2 Tax=Paraburkholderia phymatum TaxID=148447 RepID=B2JTR2_PARP8|nr:hypothetical protein Bphy_6958 [Paraburkholderia phymatum STM815]